MTAEALAAADHGPADLTPADLTAADEAGLRAALAAGVTVRELSSLDELTAVIGLFDEIWAPEDGNSLMHVELLRALTKSGNYVGGAFDLGSGKLLGACVGFFGPPAHAELHSHIAGVVPAGLGRSVGFALKLHQRAWALRRSVDVIAWTYDPLICRNAYFNLAKLGARPAEYLPNFYGAMDDAINGGTETDRMLVRWELRSGLAVAACAAKPPAVSADEERRRGAVVALSAGPDGRPVTAPPSAGQPGLRTLLVGVPADVETMRITDPAGAAEWRLALRNVLAPLLAGGARVTGFDKSGWYVVSL
jgi:predicted GNAT superfamily acetyltransferase